MKKIKLPRKRKKAYIKAKGPVEYLGMRLVNEVLGKSCFYKFKKDEFGMMQRIPGNW